MPIYGPDGNLDEEIVAGTPAFQSLVAASAVSNGLTMVGGGVRLNHVMWVIASSGVSSGAVQLQGSIDNVNWVNLGSAQSITGPFSASYTPLVVQNQLVQYLRAAITTLISGGTVTVWVASV